MCSTHHCIDIFIRCGRLSLAAALAGIALAVLAPAELSPVGTAWAEHDSHSGGRGGSSGGHTDDGHDDVVQDHTDSDHGGGRSGAGAKGGRGVHDFARGGGRSVEVKVFRGQRPVWAQEGIPEVELGRLNVSRAPAHVLARHEDEALASYSAGMAALYNLTADEAAQLLQTAYGETPRLDSPLQNLAMYQQVLVFGSTELEGIQSASAIDLAAIFLGTAADKNLPITEDTVIALNRILGLKEMPADERTALAAKANTVREAILTGHGPETDH